MDPPFNRNRFGVYPKYHVSLLFPSFGLPRLGFEILPIQRNSFLPQPQSESDKGRLPDAYHVLPPFCPGSLGMMILTVWNSPFFLVRRVTSCLISCLFHRWRRAFCCVPSPNYFWLVPLLITLLFFFFSEIDCISLSASVLL